jgi:hypothetical protein
MVLYRLTLDQLAMSRLLYGVVGSRMMILTIITDLQGLKIKIHGIFDVFALYHQIR